MIQPEQFDFRHNILVVDDNLSNLKLLSNLLSQEGYNVRKALSGEMALTSVKTRLPDLILLDIGMPDMDGYTVCRLLKADPLTAQVPVIFISALSESFDKVQAFQAGGADYITKPFQFEEVIVRIRHQLALKIAEQELLKLNADLESRVKERTQQLEDAHNELVAMALYDRLTNLPSRILFLKNLGQELNQIQRGDSTNFAVIVLDCDRFKLINNSFGHRVGDQLLQAVAQRLQELVPVDWLLARFGGDEFGILLRHIFNIDEAINFSEAILKTFSQPFSIRETEIFMSVSIGIVPGSPDYPGPEYILRDADTAMYQAKALGKRQYSLFEPEMHSTAINLLQLETDLRKALDRQELIVKYQPIVDLKTRQVHSFEALVRWRHPIRGLLSPKLFIDLAEETGLIIDIDQFVLRSACSQLRTWQKQGIVDESVSISVNLSARELIRSSLIPQIDRLLAETGLNPNNLKLEITENSIVENASLTQNLLQNLRSRRIQVSIDDFGTGYSSLSYLQSLPLDYLKIDRMFVKHLDGTSKTLGIVPLIIQIAATFNLKVVAEGIETIAQACQLQELGCDFGQGFLFAKPLTVDAVPDYLLNLYSQPASATMAVEIPVNP